MLAATIYLPAAIAEIAGCFSFWFWRRAHGSAWWAAPGVLSLVLFAWLLTLAPADNAGRAYAAYGGVYIVASLLWGWIVEGKAGSLGPGRRLHRHPGRCDHPAGAARRPVLSPPARTRTVGSFLFDDGPLRRERRSGHDLDICGAGWTSTRRALPSPGNTVASSRSAHRREKS